MAIQVVHLPTPAVGREWSYTIPGQYVATLIGVQATMATVSPLTTIADESGNGHTATITGSATDYIPAQHGPFAGGADNVAVAGLGPTAPLLDAYCDALNVAFDTLTFSADCWYRTLPAGFVGTVGLLDWFRNPGAGNKLGVNVQYPGSSAIGITYDHGLAFLFTVNNVASLNAWHHLAFTYDGTNVNTYADGTLVNATAHATFGSGTGVNVDCAGNRSIVEMQGTAAAFAFYNVALSGAQIAAHAAATGSWAAYKTAVLADSPVGLYRVGQIAVGPARTVAFQVRNGTSIVASFPVTTPAVQANTFTYSWQTLGPGAAQSVDGTTITVPIPAMTLPPGYVIGSNTLDLAGTDQWSAVTVWFDDGTGTPTPTGGQAPPYLDALLVPTNWTGGT